MNSKSSMEGRAATGEGSVTPRHCWDSASCSWPLTTHCRVTLRRKKGTWVKPSQCSVLRESLSTALDAAKSSNGRCKLDYLWRLRAYFMKNTFHFSHEGFFSAFLLGLEKHLFTLIYSWPESKQWHPSCHYKPAPVPAVVCLKWAASSRTTMPGSRCECLPAFMWGEGAAEKSFRKWIFKMGSCSEAVFPGRPCVFKSSIHLLLF